MNKTSKINPTAMTIDLRIRENKVIENIDENAFFKMIDIDEDR